MNDLTEHQNLIAKLVKSGLSNKQIARELDISEGTVKSHLHNIYNRLGIANRYALIVSSLFGRAEVLGASPSQPQASSVRENSA
jgi:DNA-binding NarL/FixJ family response regulator